MKIYYSETRHSKSKDAFLRSLGRDLRRHGHHARVVKRGARLCFYFRSRTPVAHDVRTHATFQAVRQQSLKKHINFIRQAEQAGIMTRFADPSSHDVTAADPCIQVCRTREENSLFRYCRLMQSVPTSTGVGRRLRALMLDTATDPPAVMGAIGLASPVYSQRDRDTALGRKTEALRKHGLRHIMQLCVCMAAPPYNYLRAGKLAAMLALSSPITLEFRRRYNEELLAVVTTAAGGTHAPIFKGIRLSKLVCKHGETPYSRGEMYQSIGYSAGISYSVVSQSTIDAARSLMQRHIGSRNDPVSEDPFRNNHTATRAVGRALTVSGLGRQVLQVPPKRIYLGALDTNHLHSMCAEKCCVPLALEDTDAVVHWKTTFLPAALRNGAAEKLVNYTPNIARLSRQI